MARLLIDIICPTCVNAQPVLDQWVINGAFPACKVCGDVMTRCWLPRSAVAVVGDETDVWVRHGICNPDGSPRHYTSKAEMAREAKRRGVTPMVRHVGRPGSDRNPHTTRWV